MGGLRYPTKGICDIDGTPLRLRRPSELCRVQYYCNGFDFPGASSLPMAVYSFDNGMLVQSFDGHGRWRQFTPNISATWMPGNQFNFQIQAGWFYNTYSGVADLSSSCFTAEARVAYYIGDFAINAWCTTPRTSAGYDRVVTRTIWDFGITGNWSRGNLRIEAGFCNPFLRHPHHTSDLSTPQYRFHNTQYSPNDRQSAYIKAAYTVDFGKKTKHDTPNIDKSIGSGILRAR